MKQGSITYRLYKPSDKAEFIRCIEKMQDYFVTLDTLGWQRRRKDFGPRYVNEKLLVDLKKYPGELHVAKRLESFFASEGCTLVRLEAQGNVDQLGTFYSRHGFKPWQLHMVKRLAKRRNRKTRVKIT